CPPGSWRAEFWLRDGTGIFIVIPSVTRDLVLRPPKQALPPFPSGARSLRSFGCYHSLKMTPPFPCHPESSEGFRAMAPTQALPLAVRCS
ncbi:MAG: hypothetical protein K9K68_06715, partial [Methylococcaceae bacterium]|nr:hypothetical protein [Methylococcaceae bacterium]